MTTDIRPRWGRSRNPHHGLARIAAGLALFFLIALRPGAGQSQQSGQVNPQTQAAGQEDTEPPAPQEYTGPAVLSRGNQPAIGKESALMTLQPFFYVNQIYDSGMTVTSGSGGAPLQGIAGIESGLGVRGTHQWRRIILNVNYEGNYKRYTEQTYLSGTNQYLRTIALIQLKRHLELALRQTVARVVQDLGSLSLQPVDLTGALTANEPFDNRARLFESQATLTYQKSRRLSFTGSLAGSSIRRQSTPLVGSDSLIASGDVGYLLSAHTAIAFDYSFTHYGFTTFGSTNLSTFSANLSRRLSRSVEVSLQLGVSHGSVVGLSLVPLDPDIAALLGVGTGIQVSHQAFNMPAFQGSVTKRWRVASADLSYQKGISPGNGLLLASKTESFQAGVHYSPSRLWAVSMQAGRTSMEGLTALRAGSYAGYLANVSLTRSIRPTMQLVARFDARPFTYLGQGLQSRMFYRTTIGFVFTPREQPIMLR